MGPEVNSRMGLHLSSGGRMLGNGSRKAFMHLMTDGKNEMKAPRNREHKERGPSGAGVTEVSIKCKQCMHM